MNARIFWVCAMECMCAQTRPRSVLSSKRVLGGMESEPMLTPREKVPLPEKVSPEEDRTHDTASRRTASPTHYQWAIAAPYRGLNLHSSAGGRLVYTRYASPCNDGNELLQRDCLVGLAVKASALGAEDPRFEFHFRQHFSGSSHTRDLKIGTPVATLPGPVLLGQLWDWLAWCQYTVIGWDKKVWSATSISV